MKLQLLKHNFKKDNPFLELLKKSGDLVWSRFEKEWISTKLKQDSYVENLIALKSNITPYR